MSTIADDLLGISTIAMVDTTDGPGVLHTNGLYLYKTMVSYEGILHIFTDHTKSIILRQSSCGTVVVNNSEVPSSVVPVHPGIDNVCVYLDKNKHNIQEMSRLNVKTGVSITLR